MNKLIRPEPQERKSLFANFEPDNLADDGIVRQDKNKQDFILCKGKIDKSSKIIYLSELSALQDKYKKKLFIDNFGRPAEIGIESTINLEPYLIGRSKDGLYIIC